MPQQRNPGLQHPSSFRTAVRNPGSSLRERYRDDPVGLAERFGLRLPEKPVKVMIRLGVISETEAVERFGGYEPGLRDLVEDVCAGTVTSAVVVGPRGGGKSQGVSFIEFVLSFIDDFDCLNLGGSELQADQVYQYLQTYVANDNEWKSLVNGEMQRERTTLRDGNWIRVLAASQKSTRSPHAGGGGGKKRGGLLVIDEEAEAEPGIVNSALPTINTAKPSVNIRSSTFHNAVGTFADVVDNHASMGYKLYRWDIFDVAERCGCVDGCQSSEKCFREDHVEEVLNPDTNQIDKRTIHKAYSFAGQEVVLVRSPSGLTELTTLEALFAMFAKSSKAEVVVVPAGWTIFDTIKTPGRWQGDVQWTRLKQVSRHVPVVGMRTIQAGSGDCITVTDDHPFLVTKDRSDVFIPASEVVVGDNCVIPNIVKHLASKLFSLDESIAYLVGAYLAEGNRGINARGSKWVVLSGLKDCTRLEKEASVSGFWYRVRPHSTKGSNLWFGAEFYDLLSSLGLGEETALNKRMPTNILEWDDISVAALLCGLIDGDGTIHHSRGTDIFNDLSSVSLRVASKALVTQALLCLRKLGMSGWTRYVGFYSSIFSQNFPLYGLEFSLTQEALDKLYLSEKLADGVWLRSRTYPKATGSRQKQVRSIKKAELGSPFVFDVTTESETFWCSGFRTHNCGGRAMYADGWVPMPEIEKLWRRLNRHHGTWEVEQMGSRPSSAGYVIKDIVKFNGNITVLSGKELYVPGAPTTICVDWGTVAAGVGAWQEVWTTHGMEYNLVACQQLEEYGVDEIVSAILLMRHEYEGEFLEVAADIGGGGNYMNPLLREKYGLPVRDVNFGEEKEAAAAAWNVYNESGATNIPSEFETFVSQVRRWRRDSGGRIVKRNDHLCDMSICFFAKFIEKLGLQHMRAIPRTFQTGQYSKPEIERGALGERLAPASGRAPLMRSLSSSRIARRGGW